MDLKKELQQFDLTDNEASIYMAALELGLESVQHIAQKAKLNRVTTYAVIESLIEKGLLYEDRTGTRKQIVAYSPMKLWDVVNERHKRLKKQSQKLEVLVPELKKRAASQKEKTNIQYYDGFEGMKSYSTDVLSCKGEMLEWTKIENYTSVFSEYLDEVYFPLKKERQVPTRFIFIDTPEAHAYVKERYIDDPDSPPMKARFVDKDQFDSEGSIVIYDDKYSVNIPSELKAVVIQDTIIADTQRKMFEFAWIHAKNEIVNKSYPLDK